MASPPPPLPLPDMSTAASPPHPALPPQHQNPPHPLPHQETPHPSLPPLDPNPPHHQSDMASPTPPPHPQPPPTKPPVAAVPDKFMHKNRLQEYAQQSRFPAPKYESVNEGQDHLPKFRSTVHVMGLIFTSPNTFPKLKDAEQDVAKLALHNLKNIEKRDIPNFIDLDKTFCKSILYEYCVKMNKGIPAYQSSKSEAAIPAMPAMPAIPAIATFGGSVSFDEKTYFGKYGSNKKEAEQLAAKAAIKCILEDPKSRETISSIIQSKCRMHGNASPARLNTSPQGFISHATSAPSPSVQSEVLVPVAPLGGHPSYGIESSMQVNAATGAGGICAIVAGSIGETPADTSSCCCRKRKECFVAEPSLKEAKTQ